jgi:hypothetical protein
MEPTAAQMAQLERLEADYARAVRDGVSEMVWQVRRRPSPNAKRIRIAPGLTGRLVQWGDGTWLMPSVAFVKTADVSTFLQQCRAQIASEATR